VYRWYRFEGLQIRMRVRRRKHMSLHRGPVPQARRTHESCSMDFVHDQLFGGRDGVAALGRAIERAGTLVSITIDHGTGFTSKALEEWAYRRGVKLDFIHPG
jgi:putative transposase